MIMFFPVLLIVCAVSAAQLQESDDIISNLRQTEAQVGEPDHDSATQQTHTQDIDAVLRKMAAWLAGLKVEVKHLQRENEAKTKELYSLNQQYQAQERQMKELRQQNQVQATELATVKAKASFTENRVEAQAAELATVQAKVDNAENQVEALKREGEAKRLAFSASFLALTPGDFGPFNTHTTLVFRHVVTNIGSAYNQHTEALPGTDILASEEKLHQLESQPLIALDLDGLSNLQLVPSKFGPVPQGSLISYLRPPEKF
ncbi:uncharacterized protein LOC111609547 isoform X1 [Xiphophorus maculatus]|uniref:uncharacterized protein LOC111609547 isoform X1 n=1 Tax=Xiphophorus maculatus TaxID=8083 RepID=UPI000C6DA930|nr:uncharacterized protein LOC111609547 isoform X1 [Xiphophorus maculatus]